MVPRDVLLCYFQVLSLYFQFVSLGMEQKWFSESQEMIQAGYNLILTEGIQEPQMNLAVFHRF